MLLKKLTNKVRGVLQAHGPQNVKKRMWNSEFKQGRWNCLDASPGDPVYSQIETCSKGGSILDLGCGSGSTAAELDEFAFHEYVGVDISDVALRKARTRVEEAGRADRCMFFCADIYTYVPTCHYDLILFRDSIYYIPRSKTNAVLQRYSKYLKHGGHFVVRMWNGSGKYRTIVDIIESNFRIIGKYLSERTGALVIVFQPRSGLDATARYVKRNVI